MWNSRSRVNNWPPRAREAAKDVLGALQRLRSMGLLWGDVSNDDDDQLSRAFDDFGSRDNESLQGGATTASTEARSRPGFLATKGKEKAPLWGTGAGVSGGGAATGVPPPPPPPAGLQFIEGGLDSVLPSPYREDMEQLEQAVSMRLEVAP